MKQKIFFLVLLSFLVLPSFAVANGKDSLFMDGFEIKIGESKSEVHAKFSGNNNYITTDSADSMGISTSSSVNARWVGIIKFENGQVKSISKHWSDYYVESGGLKSFQILFNLLSNLAKQGFSIAHISTSEVKQPNITADIITLKMGNRTVEISIQNTPDISGNRLAIHIDETLSK